MAPLLFIVVFSVFFTAVHATISPSSQQCLRNSQSFLQWQQFVAESAGQMKILRKQRSELITASQKPQNSYANRLSFQSRMLKLEEKRIHLWYLGMQESPLLAMNSETFPAYLPDIDAKKAKNIVESLSKLRAATDRYLTMLDRQSKRLQKQSERLNNANPFSRFFIRPWFAIRNWFSKSKRARYNLELAEKNFIMLFFTQLLRYCDRKLIAGYERMQLQPLPGETEEELKKRVQSRYMLLSGETLGPEQRATAEQAEEFERAYAYLMKSESERTKEDTEKWEETESLDMALDFLTELQWVPVPFQ